MSGWVATERQAVGVHLSDGKVLAGEVHLQLAQHHFGQETAADLFNRNEAFFALGRDDGSVTFLAKGQVLYVELLVPPDLPDDSRTSAAKRVSIALEMADGAVLGGLVIFEMPPDRMRTLDFLNAAPAFFPLWGQDAVRIINRSWIRAANPLQGGDSGTN